MGASLCNPILQNFSFYIDVTIYKNCFKSQSGLCFQKDIRLNDLAIGSLLKKEGSKLVSRLPRYKFMQVLYIYTIESTFHDKTASYKHPSSVNKVRSACFCACIDLHAFFFLNQNDRLHGFLCVSRCRKLLLSHYTTALFNRNVSEYVPSITNFVLHL